MIKNQLTLFGIPFSVYSEQQLYQVSCDLLEEPALYTIYFVSAEQCTSLAESKEMLRNSERIKWIPGDDAVRSLFSKKDRHTMAELSNLQYVMHMCEYATDMGLDVCLLMQNERELEFVSDSLRKSFPYLAIHGLSYEKASSAEAMANEINSIAPEILILGLRTGELRYYMEKGRRITNARLCICVGELLLTEMSKKKKMFHTITMGRVLKKRLRKYSKREQ